MTFDAIDVSFDAIEDPSERRAFMEMPTTFFLPEASIDRLRALGGRLLRNSRPYKILLERIAEPRNATADKQCKGSFVLGVWVPQRLPPAAMARWIQ